MIIGTFQIAFLQNKNIFIILYLLIYRHKKNAYPRLVRYAICDVGMR